MSSIFIRAALIAVLLQACGQFRDMEAEDDSHSDLNGSPSADSVATDVEPAAPRATPGCVPGEIVFHAGEGDMGMSYDNCGLVRVQNTAPVAALGGQYLAPQDMCILCGRSQLQCVGSDDNRDLMRVLSNTKVAVVARVDSCGPDTLFFQDTDVTERFRQFAVDDARQKEKRRLEAEQNAAAYQEQLVRDQDVVRRLIDTETKAKRH